MKLYFATNQFPELQFLGPHHKPNGVRGLDKNYHMHFGIKIGHDTCEISHIHCAWTSCTYILYQLWVTGIPEHHQTCYQPVKYCTYWNVLGWFNNFNILQLSHKETSSEETYRIFQVGLDGISEKEIVRDEICLEMMHLFKKIKILNTK